jgi:EAL domain-containing protein (putative c-di-GMP-specific phosphodiesterase class I)
MQSAPTQDDILDGIHCDEFEIHFQPMMEAATLRVVGVEALARWSHKGRYVPPTLFIAAAERYGLIPIMSEALLSKSLVASARLAERGFPLPVSINLSAPWLTNIHLPELVHACVVGTGLKPQDVTLEITEAGLADGMANALNALTRLRLMGFGLSIDDFGADAISLEQLERFEVRELKIDSGVLHKATQSPAARSVFAATVGMARELKLGSVVQGIESREHLDLARSAGCEMVQGWFIAPPMPVADLAVWLQERHA